MLIVGILRSWELLKDLLWVFVVHVMTTRGAVHNTVSNDGTWEVSPQNEMRAQGLSSALQGGNVISLLWTSCWSGIPWHCETSFHVALCTICSILKKYGVQLSFLVYTRSIKKKKRKSSNFSGYVHSNLDFYC